VAGRQRDTGWQAFGQEPLRRRTIDNLRYFREGGQGNVETKRGCNQHCIYCADPAGKGTHLRLRPPEAVAGEIRNLLAQGVDVLHLCDSEFNIPGEHARAVCDELIRQGLGERARWYAYLSPTPFDVDLARRMAPRRVRRDQLRHRQRQRPHPTVSRPRTHA